MSRFVSSSRKPIQRAAATAVEQLEGRLLFYGTTVDVDANDTHQTMDGFGAAMATWKSVTGYDDAAFYDRIVNDLGATIARTAVWPTFEEGNDNEDPNQFDWSGYDKSAIGYAMTFMKRLQDRGMTNLLASVWTPPTYLRTNQTYYYGGTVRPDLREEFAEYLAAVAISADRDFGVNLSHISVQNEPFFVQEFESATYTPQQMREVVRATMRKFAHEKIDAQFVVPEEMAKDERFKWYVDALMNDPETRNFPGAFGVHSATKPFWGEIGDITRPHAQNLWSTESHGHEQTMEGALSMAQDIWNAVVQADASAYVYWQWTEDADDGEHSLMVDGQPAIKYQVAKHFYRYIRPGMVRVDASTGGENRLRTMSFKDPNTGAMTHVLFNNEDGSEANVTLNLSGGNLPGSYKAYRTRAGENHISVGTVTGGSQVKITLPANSIVTLYSGPDLPQVQASSGGPLPARDGLEDASDERLNRAAIEGDIGDVREFLSQGDDVNHTLHHGYSALHGAAASPYAGAVEVINELLKAGARTSQATTEGLTPLHFAAMNVWTRGETTEGPLAGDKIRALSAGGADENAADNQGRTPLHWAAMMPKLADIEDLTLDPVVVDALLDGGASVNAKDDQGFTPLDYAVREGNTAAASELKRHGGVHGEGEPETPPPPPPPTGDSTRPTVAFTAVTPDPRDVAVHTVSLTFSEPVNGVGLDDFRLTRDGRNVMPSGAAVVRVNGSTYRVTGLAAATGIAGSYMLKLDKDVAGITDASGNTLLSSESENWTVTGGVGATPRQTVLGTNGKDLIIVKESGGEVVVEVNGIEQAIDAGPGEVLIDALDGDDRIIVEVAAPRKLLMTGSTGRDTINGGPGAEELSGGVGMDRIYAGDGDDFLIGGGHNDYLNGQGGTDLILGSGGNDRLYGGGGSDWLIGMLGNDVLFGNPGSADTTSGNDGTDTVVDADDGTNGSSNLDTIAGIESFIRTT